MPYNSSSFKLLARCSLNTNAKVPSMNSARNMSITRLKYWKLQEVSTFSLPIINNMRLITSLYKFWDFQKPFNYSNTYFFHQEKTRTGSGKKDLIFYVIIVIHSRCHIICKRIYRFVTYSVIYYTNSMCINCVQWKEYFVSLSLSRLAYKFILTSDKNKQTRKKNDFFFLM